ncbi:MAG: PAS domain-containing protein [Myxococcota bacterium]
MARHLAEAAVGPPQRTLEYRFRRADGTHAWLETLGRVLTDEQGTPNRIIFSSRDVSARHQAECRLETSEQRFRALFETSLAPIVVTDEPGRYLAVNDAACRLFQLEREQLLSLRVADLTAAGTPAGEQFEPFKRAGRRRRTTRASKSRSTPAGYGSWSSSWFTTPLPSRAAVRARSPGDSCAHVEGNWG